MPLSFRAYYPLTLYTVFFVFFALYLQPLYQVAFIALAIWIWQIRGENDTKKKSSEFQLSLWFVLPISLFILFVALSPFLAGHPAPLGYDTGIYSSEFQIAFDRLPDFNVGVHPGIFFFGDALHLLGANAAFMMREVYILLYLLLGFTIYAVTKTLWNRNAAIVAFLIFALSSVQFAAYTFVLYKNILGLSLLLLSLLLIQKRSWLLLPVGIFLAILQPTHFVIFGLTLIVFWLLNFRNRKDCIFFLSIGSIVLLLSIMVLMKNQGILSTAWEVLLKKDRLSNGSFMEVADAVKDMLLYIPFAIYGGLALLKSKKGSAFLIASLAVFLLVFLRMFFYRRYLIELDLFLIIFAGIGVTSILPKILHDTFLKSSIGIMVFLLLGSQILTITNYLPQISHAELNRIRTLCTTIESDALIMATHNLYSPWLRGFSCHNVYAPGLFEANQWDEPTWQIFWNGSKEQREMLMNTSFTAGQTLYVYIGDLQPAMDFSGHSGFEKISDHLWRWQKNSKK